jgi:hypothetical protein
LGKGFSIRKTVGGLMIVPVKKGGEPLTEEEYEALEEGIKAKVDEIGKQLQEKLNDIAREVRGGKERKGTAVETRESRAFGCRALYGGPEK